MERINSLLVGAPRQGKSVWGEKQLVEYAKNGGVSVVYNVGKPGDFERFFSVEIIDASKYKELWEKKHRRQMSNFDTPKEVNFFKFNNKVYHLSQFCKLFKGKCVKIERVLNKGNLRNEDFLIASIYKYFYNTLVMMDDCRTIFRKGLSSEMIGLLSRINHAGKEYAPRREMIGIDTILTYHGFETVNNETYQFVNLLVQFITLSAPSTGIDNPEIESQIRENYNELKQSQKYSHFEYDPFSGINTFFNP